jgi:hypothetical protein
MRTQAHIYGGAARFDANAFMTEDAIRAVAPSVFAVTKHDSRSDRFAPIPTIEILRGLAKEGFQVVGARQNTARTDDKREYTKHLLRLRRFGADMTRYAVGDTVCEMYLQNANDGTSAYNLSSSLFRIACLNSMTMKLATLDEVKVYHSGNSERVMNKVIEGTFRVLDNSTLALEAPRQWNTISLDGDEQRLFADAAALVRWGAPTEEVENSDDVREAAVTTYNPLGLLTARRVEDRSNDLWTLFNRVQENAIRGGVGGRTLGVNGNVRKATSRPVKAIDTDIKINKRLFDLADAFAQLKGAKTISGADPKAVMMAA